MSYNWSGPEIAPGNTGTGSEPADMGNCFQISHLIETQTPVLSPLWMSLAPVSGLIFGSLTAAIIAITIFKKHRAAAAVKAAKEAKGQKLVPEKRLIEPNPEHRTTVPPPPLTLPNSNGALRNVSLSQPINLALQNELKKVVAPLTLPDFKRTSVALPEEPSPPQLPPEHNDSFASMLVSDNCAEAEAELASRSVQAIETMEETANDYRRKKLILQLGEAVAIALAKEILPATSVDAVTETVKETYVSKPEMHSAAMETLSHDEAVPEASNFRSLSRMQLIDKITDKLEKTDAIASEQKEEYLTKLKKALANVERITNESVALRVKNLEEASAVRSYLLEQKTSAAESAENVVNDNLTATVSTLSTLVQKSSMTDSDAAGLESEHKRQLGQLKQKHGEAIAVKLRQLQTKLEKHRNGVLQNLHQRHEAKLQQLQKSALTLKNADNFVEEARSLMIANTREVAATTETLDREEAQKIEQEKMTLEQQLKAAMLTENERLMRQLSERCPQLSQNEIQALFRRHRIECSEHEKAREMNRVIQNAELKRKLEERRKSYKPVNLSTDGTQTEELELVQTVIDQHGFGDREIEQVMLEHGLQQQSLQSKLLFTKLKHEKRLNQLLAQRRAQAALNPKQDEIENNSKLGDDLEGIRQNMQQELRKKLAEETGIALAEQDKRMAKIIGKLQAEQARRALAIRDQEVALKKLEENLRRAETYLATKPNPSEVRNLISEHKHEIQQWKRGLDDMRRRQLETLEVRLREKRAQRTGDSGNKENIGPAEIENASPNVDLHLRVRREYHSQMTSALIDYRKQFMDRLAVVCKLPVEQQQMALPSNTVANNISGRCVIGADSPTGAV